MNSILIRGTSNSGKSTTIRAICESLNPSKVWRVDDWANAPRLVTESIANIQNGTYFIEVSGKIVLIIAGSPTEQKITVFEIIEICRDLADEELGRAINIVIVAMRSYERAKDYNTPEKLKEVGTLIHEEPIKRIEIENDNFQSTPEWKGRISRLVQLVQNNL